MNHKRLKALSVLFLLSYVFAYTLMPISFVKAMDEQSPVQQEIGTNLLTNPGFEGFGKPNNNGSPNPGNWTRETFTGAVYGEIFTPEGWVTWWQEGDFGRPECKVIPNEHPFSADPERIYEGYYAGMCFTFFRKQNAGYYQVVRNIAPGSVVEGSFFAHAWSCSEDNPPRSCGDAYSFYFRVGIDPNGGTDPFSSNIVWSAPAYLYDEFGYVGPVQATVGESGAATIFTQAYGKWPNKHNDAYMDNMSMKLVSTGETPTPTTAPPPPTSELPPTPQYTPTPLPNGAIVHTVVAGDTLFGIALTYDVPIDDIYSLNDLNSQSLLSIGQEVVIAIDPSFVATPTPVPQEPDPTTAPVQEQPGGADPGGVPAAPVGDTASLCVLAFYDANNDLFRQAENGEMTLPNAEINILATSGPVGTYRTDGISEPYCFQNLEAGSYVLRHTAPPGYKTDFGQSNIALGAGQITTIELGYMRDDSSASGEQNSQQSPATPDQNQGEETPTEEPEGSGMTKTLNTILRVSGGIVLVLAIAVAALFFISRRSI